MINRSYIIDKNDRFSCPLVTSSIKRRLFGYLFATQQKHTKKRNSTFTAAPQVKVTVRLYVTVMKHASNKFVFWNLCFKSEISLYYFQSIFILYPLECFKQSDAIFSLIFEIIVSRKKTRLNFASRVNHLFFKFSKSRSGISSYKYVCPSNEYKKMRLVRDKYSIVLS